MSLFNSPQGQQAMMGLSSRIPQLGAALQSATGPNGVPLWDGQPNASGPMAAALGKIIPQIPQATPETPPPAPVSLPATPAPTNPITPLADLAARTVPQSSPQMPVEPAARSVPGTPDGGGNSQLNRMFSTLFSRTPGQFMGGWGQPNAG